MCVMLHALHKRLIKRSEVETAMRNNSFGFFLYALDPDGTRHTLRTLNQLDALQFYDTIPDESEVAMHFRVPSKGVGGATLDNVHGWESEGILFSHNRTLYNILPLMKDDSWVGTDSEYFFRRIFIPMYRRYGRRAYKDGKLNPMIDHIIRAICGDYNKFMFIMPDNKILLYGKWEGDDSSREGFHASNMSYLDLPTSRNWLERIREFFRR